MDEIFSSFATVMSTTLEGVTSAPDPHVPRIFSYFLALYLFVVGVIGCVGNSAVIAIFTKTKSLKTPANMLIINLAISDLFMVITQFPAMFLTTVAGKWLYGDIGCQIYAFFGSTFGVLSIASVSAISVDRYYAICKPISMATRTKPKSRSWRIIMFVWLYTLMWAVPPLFGFGHYTREGYGLSCTFDYVDQSLSNMIFVGMLFVTDFFLPLLLIICCYSKIVLTVKAHNREMNKVIGTKDDARLKAINNKKKEFKIAKIGMIMAAIFCITWLPYATVAFISEFIDSNFLTPLLQTLPVVFAKSSSVLNPIVYVVSHEKFRVALTERFLHSCCTGYMKEIAAHKMYGTQQRSRFTNARTDTSVTSKGVSEDMSEERQETVLSATSKGEVSADISVIVPSSGTDNPINVEDN